MENITFDNSIFRLETKNTAYVLGINEDNRLYHSYFGSKAAYVPAPKAPEVIFFNHKGIFYPEYTVYDGSNLFDNTAEIVFTPDDRCSNCLYDSHLIDDNILTIILKDSSYDLTLELVYEVIPELDLIKKKARFTNETEYDVTIKRAFSGCLTLPGTLWNLGSLHGGWGNEMNFTMQPLSNGTKTLESRMGNSGHFFNPSFLLTKDPSPKEGSGEIYFGQLIYSGSFKMNFEQRGYGVLTANIGINDFDSQFTLEPNESFETPFLLIGYSDSGLTKMSQSLHDYHRAQKPSKETVPISYNSWEACYFNFNEDLLKKMASLAKEIGAEVFTVDDGWFLGRNDDTTSLGDWQEDLMKIPGGMKKLGDFVRSLGMKFGIWTEPEAISPVSRLYQLHPDWCYNFKDRERTLWRNQLVLNITMPDVFDYVKHCLKKIVIDYGADYIKWDMNRPILEAGAENLGPKHAGLIYTKHTQAVYDLMDYARSLKPGLIIEGCSGGGGRYDAGLIPHTDVIWASDNTDPMSRQFIQYGASLFYPVNIMGAHVASSPSHQTQRDSTLNFRCLTAMSGVMGVQADISKWTADELKFLSGRISLYKKIRNTVQNGDLFRSTSPYTHSINEYTYVSKDRSHAVHFAFMLKEDIKTLTVFPKGLDPELIYEFNGARASGSAIMQGGVTSALKKIQDCAILTFYHHPS